MAKDAVATMGGPLPDDAGGRDAVHVAVFSATADKKLHAGQDVGVVEQGEPDTKVSATADPIGIVDPYLKTPVMPGERFWVYLYPRSITSLSHRWGHPSFETQTTTYAPPSQKVASEQWLRDFCEKSDCPSYERVMAVIVEGRIEGDRSDYGYGGAYIDDEYMHFTGSDAHGEIPPEFWMHVENVLGHPVKTKPTYFSCSC